MSTGSSNDSAAGRHPVRDKVVTGLTLVELVTTPGAIPLPVGPDVSRANDQVIAAPMGPPAPVHPAVAQLAGHREKLQLEQQERELDLALALREPLPAERSPETRNER